MAGYSYAVIGFFFNRMWSKNSLIILHFVNNLRMMTYANGFKLALDVNLFKGMVCTSSSHVTWSGLSINMT